MKEITPLAAYALLQSKPQAVLVDVRTPEELERTGTPLGALFVPYADASWRPLAGFAQAFARVAQPGDELLLICRSGKRSRDAALLLESLGYSDLTNVLYGVEGDADAQGKRMSINGWAVDQLPLVAVPAAQRTRAA